MTSNVFEVSFDKQWNRKKIGNYSCFFFKCVRSTYSLFIFIWEKALGSQKSTAFWVGRLCCRFQAAVKTIVQVLRREVFLRLLHFGAPQRMTLTSYSSPARIVKLPAAVVFFTVRDFSVIASIVLFSTVIVKLFEKNLWKLVHVRNIYWKVFHSHTDAMSGDLYTKLHRSVIPLAFPRTTRVLL